MTELAMLVQESLADSPKRPIVEALHAWLKEQLPGLSGGSDLAKAMLYALRHWSGLVAFLDDGRIEMDTNVVERAIRPVTLNRKNALFAGSDGGARHWAIAMMLINTAKPNGVEPMAWLISVLGRVVSWRTKANELDSLLPWNWKAPNAAATSATMAACNRPLLILSRLHPTKPKPSAPATTLTAKIGSQTLLAS